MSNRCSVRRVQGISRREFLGSATGALALSFCARGVQAAGPATTAAKVVVGAHPWIYAAKRPNRDIAPILDAIFADMRYAGMDGIELMHTVLHPEDAVERIADLSRRHTLPIIGSSFTPGAMWDRKQHPAILKEAELVIPRLAKLNGRTLGVSVGAAPKKKTPQQLEDQAGLLRRILGICQSYGVVLNLHNHTYEVADDLYDLKGTLARIPNVKLGPDLNWLVRGGVDPAEFLRRYGKQIVFLHLRDQRADGRWSEALGEGNMNYAEIARALQAIEFRGTAVIELAHETDFTPTRPLRESLRISRDFVRRTLGY